MEVKSLVKREPIVVELGTPLRTAAQIMVKENIGLLPIVSPVTTAGSSELFPNGTL